MIVVFIIYIGWYNRYGKSNYIHGEIDQITCRAEYLHVPLFDYFAKHIQGKHIENKMTPIGMDQPTTKETIELTAADSRRIKNKLFQEILIAKGHKRNNTGCRNDNNGDRNFHPVNLFIYGDIFHFLILYMRGILVRQVSILRAGAEK